MKRRFSDITRRLRHGVRRSVHNKRLSAAAIKRRHRLPGRLASYRRGIKGMTAVRRYRLPASLRYRLRSRTATAFKIINRPLTIHALLRLSMHRVYQTARWLAVMKLRKRGISLVPTLQRGNAYRTAPAVQRRRAPLNEAGHNKRSHSLVPTLLRGNAYRTPAVQRRSVPPTRGLLVPTLSRGNAYRAPTVQWRSVLSSGASQHPPRSAPSAGGLVPSRRVYHAIPPKDASRPAPQERYGMRSHAAAWERGKPTLIRHRLFSRSMERTPSVAHSQVLVRAAVVQPNKPAAIIGALRSGARRPLNERLTSAGSRTTNPDKRTARAVLGSRHPSSTPFVHRRGERVRPTQAVSHPVALEYARPATRQEIRVTSQETMQKTITENIVRRVEKTLSEQIERRFSSRSEGSRQWIERVYTDLNDRIVLERERLNPR